MFFLHIQSYLHLQMSCTLNLDVGSKRQCRNLDTCPRLVQTSARISITKQHRQDRVGINKESHQNLTGNTVGSGKNSRYASFIAAKSAMFVRYTLHLTMFSKLEPESLRTLEMTVIIILYSIASANALNGFSRASMAIKLEDRANFIPFGL